MPWDPVARPPAAPPPPRAAARPVGTSDVAPEAVVSPVGKTYGRYRILSVIQRGGMGEIFLGEFIDPVQYGQQVVLKRLLADFDEDERYRSMFGAEARVMLRMDHPNIVKVFDAPMIEGKPCLAMEFVHGRNVNQILKRCRKSGRLMPPQIAVSILLHVLEGLQYAHTMVLEDGCPLDLVHRDVTPGNILVSFDGAVKMTDFGIAKSKMSVVSTTVGVVKGTTRYLSPEQIRSENVDGRSDIFSAATVLTEMLTGAPLFDRGAVPPTLFAIIKGQRKPIADLLPFPAPRLAAALEKALSVSPRDRFTSAEAFAAALRDAQRELGRPLAPGALGRFVQELFDDRPVPVKKPKPVAGPENPSLDLTYLFEVNEGSGSHAVREISALDTPDIEAISGDLAGGTPLSAEQFEAPRAAPPPPPPVSQRMELPEFPDVETSPSRSVPISEVGVERSEALRPLDLMDEVARELDIDAPPPPRFPPARSPSNGTPARLRAPYRPTPSRLPADLFVEPSTQDVEAEADAFSSNRALILGALEEAVSPQVVEDDAATSASSEVAARPARSTKTRVLFLAGILCGALLVWGMTALVAGMFEEAPEAPKRAERTTRSVAPASEAPSAQDPAAPDSATAPVPAAAPNAVEAPIVSTSPEAASGAERGHIDLLRPRGARVFIDGVRLSKRVPIRDFRVEPGHRKILVTKGRYRRWLEIDVEAGQYFDLTDGEIVEVDATPDQ
ncbi:MAG: serine/threonine-protein kinase [Deltaproteobacteria bacterium]